MVDLRHVAGRRALVVKGVGGHVHGAVGAFVHGHHGRSDALIQIFRAQGPALHEHVHFHAVPEGFVGDQPRHVRSGDDVVGAGDHALSLHQIGGNGQHLVQLVFKGFSKELRPHAAGNAVIGHAHLAAVRRDCHDAALRIDVGLPQVAVFRLEQFGNVGGLGVQAQIHELAALFHAFPGEPVQAFDQHGQVFRFRQSAGLKGGIQLFGPVRQAAGLIWRDARGFQHRALEVKGGLDLRRRLVHAAGVIVVEGIFKIAPVAVQPHHVPALSGHGFMSEALHTGGDPQGEAHGIRRQDAHVFKFFTEPVDQAAHQRRFLSQVAGKGCFHIVVQLL